MKRYSEKSHKFTRWGGTGILIIIAIIAFIGVSQIRKNPRKAQLQQTGQETPQRESLTAIPSSKRKTADEYLGDVIAIDLDSRDYPVYNDYYQEVYRRVNTIIRSITDLDILESLFYACNHQIDQLSPRTIDWINPCYECAEAILHHLSVMHTEQSIELLVKLFSDETIPYDGGYSLAVGNCIVRSGEMAIKYLLNVNNSRRNRAQEFIKLIRAGRTTYS